MNTMLCLVLLLLMASPTAAQLLYPLDWLLKYLKIAADLAVIPKEPEYRKTVPEVIQLAGYPAQNHTVTTEDFYTLDLFRIPYGKNGNVSSSSKGSVLLLHGLQANSICWVWNIPSKNLAYILADAGYDVWLGNFRGSKYALGNLNYSSDSANFWNFSWDDMAKYDAPAMIDYILSTTGSTKLALVGHSMGTTVSFAMLAGRPEYNAKVSVVVCFAPVAFVDNMKSPLRLISVANSELLNVVNTAANGRLTGGGPFGHAVLSAVCSILVDPLVCLTVAYAIGGPNYKQANFTRVPYYFSEYPDDASVRTLQQYGQGINSKQFQRFDYGTALNMEKYGQSSPPQYNPSLITAPVVMYKGKGDWLSDPKDVARLENLLPNLVASVFVNDSSWCHIDFQIAVDVVPLLYNYAVEQIESFTPPT